VASIALLVAVSGTAIAATNLANGDKLIAKNSLSGNRIRNRTITATQINLSKLGKVPSARAADSAKTATLATNATNATKATTAASATTALSATNATNATNATTLAGQAASAFDPAANFLRSGIVTANIGQTTPIGTIGPFTFALKCTDAGAGQATSEVDVTSTDGNSTADANPLSGTPFPLQTNTDSAFSVTSDTPWTLFASTGKAWFAVVAAGNKYLSKDCFGTALVGQD
jgi:hypothetical protein